MAYTTLRVTDRGVVLYAQHLARLHRAGDEAAAAFLEFAEEATPGVYSLRWDGAALTVKGLAGSRLVEGMPTRLLPSPLRGSQRIDKPPPEGPYSAVRADGVVTLLTSPSGDELYEACVASLLAWDGTRLLCAPLDRPRVLSTSEEALRADLDLLPSVLRADADHPLLLLNAVKGTCAPAHPGRPDFPAALRATLDAWLERTAFRP